uniref:Peptidase A1 domain-containing protein n=1 Tax=Fibrocapsa japonica TaxID=94617 RepID=A0A7S2V4I1_9STRA|mmetsp:Transcript_3898/g.5797  ORF Transcript_3898/g.5797 Transcript_3898/m.5797 type:complete len:212 (+) Transcript_3898:3-638(+)
MMMAIMNSHPCTVIGSGVFCMCGGSNAGDDVLSQYPNVTLDLYSGHDSLGKVSHTRFTLLPSDYFVPAFSDRSGTVFCYAAIQPVPTEDWAKGWDVFVLGTTFLKAYYAVFDMDGSQVGFARSIGSGTVKSYEMEGKFSLEVFFQQCPPLLLAALAGTAILLLALWAFSPVSPAPGEEEEGPRRMYAMAASINGYDNVPSTMQQQTPTTNL